MIIKKFKFNPFPVNSYVIADEVSKECAIIDPGCYWQEEVEQLVEYIRGEEYTVKYILLTHLHLDHILAVPFIKEAFPDAIFCANEKDAFLMQGAAQQASAFGLKLPVEPIGIEKNIEDKDVLYLGEKSIHVISVPGHSPGSLCYLVNDAKALFVGDVLFKQSIGRTDLPGGNHQDLLENIQKKLFILDDTICVYSGHGPETTIGDEKNFNPFF